MRAYGIGTIVIGAILWIWGLFYLFGVESSTDSEIAQGIAFVIAMGALITPGLILEAVGIALLRIETAIESIEITRRNVTDVKYDLHDLESPTAE